MCLEYYSFVAQCLVKLRIKNPNRTLERADSSVPTHLMSGKDVSENTESVRLQCWINNT
jgi:hypothetical protein